MSVAQIYPGQHVMQADQYVPLYCEQLSDIQEVSMSVGQCLSPDDFFLSFFPVILSRSPVTLAALPGSQ